MDAAALDPYRFLDLELTAPDLPAEEPLQPWRLRLLEAAEFSALGAGDELTLDQLAYLAHLHVLAPNSHNTMPQRFRFGRGELGVWLDRSLVLAETDPSGRQAMVSLGCGIANVVVGARSFGWNARVDVVTDRLEATRPLIPGEPRFSHIAQISFRPGPSPLGPSLLAAMLARKTVRAEYDERIPLPAELAAEASALVAAHEDLRLHLLTDAASLLFLAKFQELADTTVFNREGYARELGDWLIENDSPAHRGMRGREFGLSDEATRRIHRGLSGELRLFPDEVAGFARAGKIGMRSSSAVAVITVSDDTPAQRLAAGWAFEEVALLLQRHGFVTAMHAGITEVDAPNFALRGRLRTTSRPTVVFRIGKVLRPEDTRRPHASRPALRDLVLPSEG